MMIKSIPCLRSRVNPPVMAGPGEIEIEIESRETQEGPLKMSSLSAFLPKKKTTASAAAPPPPPLASKEEPTDSSLPQFPKVRSLTRLISSLSSLGISNCRVSAADQSL